jgi:hypothetical protein
MWSVRADRHFLENSVNCQDAKSNEGGWTKSGGGA